MVKKNSYIINIKKKSIGKISTFISSILIGKLKKNYIKNKTNGDLINIINIKNVFFSGKFKYKNKIIYRHSRYPGKLKKISTENIFKKNKKNFFLKSIKNMIKKNKLRKNLIKNIRINNNIKEIKPKIYKILNI